MDQVELYKQILGRARARPDKLPVFQDITTVSHIKQDILRLKQIRLEEIIEHEQARRRQLLSPLGTQLTIQSSTKSPNSNRFLNQMKKKFQIYFFRISRVITKCPWSGTQRQAGSIIATILVKWLHLLADKINNKFN